MKTATGGQAGNKKKPQPHGESFVADRNDKKNDKKKQ